MITNKQFDASISSATEQRFFLFPTLLRRQPIYLSLHLDMVGIEQHCNMLLQAHKCYFSTNTSRAWRFSLRTDITFLCFFFFIILFQYCVVWGHKNLFPGRGISFSFNSLLFPCNMFWPIVVYLLYYQVFQHLPPCFVLLHGKAQHNRLSFQKVLLFVLRVFNLCWC